MEGDNKENSKMKKKSKDKTRKWTYNEKLKHK